MMLGHTCQACSFILCQLFKFGYGFCHIVVGDTLRMASAEASPLRKPARLNRPDHPDDIIGFAQDRRGDLAGAQ